MGTLLGGAYEKENNLSRRFSREDSQIYSAHTGQPFYGIPVFMDDFKCTENKNGDYGCIGLFPSTPQWSNFISVVFQSPLPSYIWNSLLVSVIVVALQIFTGALLAYAMVFLEFKGRNLLFLIVMGTYMLPVAATYIPSYIILSKWNLLNTLTGLVISSTVSIFGISCCVRHLCRCQRD